MVWIALDVRRVADGEIETRRIGKTEIIYATDSQRFHNGNTITTTSQSCSDHLYTRVAGIK